MGTDNLMILKAFPLSQLLGFSAVTHTLRPVVDRLLVFGATNHRAHHAAVQVHAPNLPKHLLSVFLALLPLSRQPVSLTDVQHLASMLPDKPAWRPGPGLLKGPVSFLFHIQILGWI